MRSGPLRVSQDFASEGDPWKRNSLRRYCKPTPPHLEKAPPHVHGGAGGPVFPLRSPDGLWGGHPGDGTAHRQPAGPYGQRHPPAGGAAHLADGARGGTPGGHRHLLSSRWRKEGGEYATLTGRLKRLDPVERVLLFEAGERVPIGDILSMAEH